MARKPVNYWEKRSTELMKELEKNTQYTINDLIKIYNHATKNINKEIETIFKNFGKHGILEKDVLKQLLNKRETEVHYKNLLKVINENIKDENLKKKLLTKCNAPAYAYRISRLQELQDNINIEMYKLAKLEQNITESRYIKTIDEAYYHTIYDIQKGTGYAFSFSHLNTNTLNLMLANKWIDNKNYSQRIWNNTEKLGRYLKTNLTADMITGKSVQKISKNLSEYMNVGTYNATRLVRTEVNHFANEAEMLGYEECEIKKYQFIATLDNRTCNKCASLDNRVFNVKDRKTGVNYPPMHANDRCTTVAYFDDEVTEGLERRARDGDNNSILVPQNTGYDKWYSSYVNRSFRDGNYKNNNNTFKEYGDSKWITQNISNICDKLHNNSNNNQIESIVLIDKNTEIQKGNIYTNKNKNAVNFSIEQQNIVQISKDRSLIVVHNHPSNNTFSPDDIYNYVENKKISDIIVTTEKFNYFLSVDEKMLNSTKRNINEFKKWFEGTLKKEIKKYNNIKIDNEIYNSIYIEIFNRIGWNYGRKRKI